MKKVLTGILMTAVLLGGCSVKDTALQSELDRRITAAESLAADKPTTHKDYYSYYIDPSIGRIDSTVSGNRFVCDDGEFVMNLYVSSLINRKYYPEAETETEHLEGSEIAARRTGTFTDYEGGEHEYRIEILKAGDVYITELTTDTMRFSGISDQYSAPGIAVSMFRIARSVDVNTPEVISAYSLKETIVYKSNKLELFDSVAPESGKVEDLFEDTRKTSENVREEDQQTDSQEN